MRCWVHRELGVGAVEAEPTIQLDRELFVLHEAVDGADVLLLGIENVRVDVVSRKVGALDVEVIGLETLLDRKKLAVLFTSDTTKIAAKEGTNSATDMRGSDVRGRLRARSLRALRVEARLELGEDRGRTWLLDGEILHQPAEEGVLLGDHAIVGGGDRCRHDDRRLGPRRVGAQRLDDPG
jgi:hypothetical protein